MKSLLTVLRSVADTPASLRPCDAWRLYETAQTAGCLVPMKELIRAHNQNAYEAMMEYEAEEMTAIHQSTIAPAP